MEQNFDAFMALIWPSDGDFDSPLQGYHVTPGDAGGGTKGGVIEATWEHYVSLGLVSGALEYASDASLETVLRADVWGSVGDALPRGLDILVANGRMMTGHYASIVEQCLGWTGSAVDNNIGPHDMARIEDSDIHTLLLALHGNHWRYLASLSTWPEFGAGWTRRLNAALAAAQSLV